MKKIICIIFMALVLFSCDKENNSNDYEEIELTPNIISNYYQDAKQLYFCEIFNDSTHVNFNKPLLDYNQIDEILKIIQSVYNSKSPERDTVFDVYQIHGYYCYSFNSIGLEVNPNSSEIENLSNGIIPTGETHLDQILNTYKFDSVKTSYSYPDFPWLTIFTSDEYNLIPVEKEISEIESVFIADFNKGCIGDGNTITLTRDSSSAMITFSIGSGDCPAGCIYHKYWEFKVSNGMAEFVRTYEN